MIPKEVWQKVLKVSGSITRAVTVGANITVSEEIGLGTAFTVDRGEKQYLVSANHLFKKGATPCFAKVDSNTKKEIYEKLDTESPLRDEQEDVIVFPLKEPITPSYKLALEGKNTVQGQDVYFLGFLQGGSVSGGTTAELNNGFPRPFIKKGIIAGYRIPYPGLDEDLYQDIYIDARGDDGFSGGPVVSLHNGKVQIIGVIIGRLTEHYVCKESPQGKCGEKNPKETTLKLDTGIAHASYIEHALSLIEEYENSN